MPGLDAFQKRTLEHDLKASGLTRSQAKLAVSRVHQALVTGQLRVGGGMLPAVLGWLGLGQRQGHQAKLQHQARAEHKCSCAGACDAACQCASPRQPAKAS